MVPVTGIGIVDWFLGLLNMWGYPLVVAFTISENLFVIGSFTPGETIVMAAAFLSTPNQGQLSLPIVWVCSVVGTVIGSNLSYWFGRRGGRESLLRIGRWFRVDEERIQAAEAYFYRYGSKTVFISRFAAGFKNFVPVIAGVSKMELAYFEAWTLLGAITYTSLMCAVGYFVGNNFDRALSIAANIGYVGIGIFVVFIFVLLVGRQRFLDSRTDKYAEEYEEEREQIEEVLGCASPDSDESCDDEPEDEPEDDDR